MSKLKCTEISVTSRALSPVYQIPGSSRMEAAVLNSCTQHPFNKLPIIHHTWTLGRMDFAFWGCREPILLYGAWLKLRFWLNDALGGLAKWHNG